MGPKACYYNLYRLGRMNARDRALLLIQMQTLEIKTLMVVKLTVTTYIQKTDSGGNDSSVCSATENSDSGVVDLDSDSVHGADGDSVQV